MTNVTPKYIVVLKDPSGNVWDFEKATNIEWTRYENSVGQCKFDLAYNDSKLTQCLTDDEKLFEILIYRDEVLYWQGYVAFLLDTLDKTTVYGLDFKECLKWYRTRYNQVYTGKKIGSEIISPEWDNIAGRTGTLLGSPKIIKGTIQDPYTTGTTTEKTIDRTLFDEDFYSLVQEMTFLARSNSPSGAWTQNAVFDISLSETSPTFSFLRNVGENKPDVVFELGSEIINFYVPKDYRFIRNDVKGLSIVQGPKIINSSQTDTTSRGKYSLRQISNVFGNLTSQSELDEKTKDYLKNFKDPRPDVSFAFAPGLKPFDGYSMGDNVQVRCERGRVSINEYRRVVGMEIKIDNSGAETVAPILDKIRT